MCFWFGRSGECGAQQRKMPFIPGEEHQDPPSPPRQFVLPGTFKEEAWQHSMHLKHGPSDGYALFGNYFSKNISISKFTLHFNVRDRKRRLHKWKKNALNALMTQKPTKYLRKESNLGFNYININQKLPGCSNKKCHIRWWYQVLWTIKHKSANKELR